MSQRLPMIPLLVLVSCLPALGIEPLKASLNAPGEPDVNAVRSAGVRTKERLIDSAASWTAVISTSGGRHVSLEILRTPTARRTIVSTTDENGRPVEIARIIERDGLWYVQEEGAKPGKYRTGECPFRFAAIPFFAARAELRPVIATESMGQFDGIVDGVASYRVPLDQATRSQFEGILRQVKELSQKDPSFLDRPGMKERVGLFEGLLTRGMPMKIDIQDGVLREFGQPTSLQTQVSRINWQPKADAAEFSVEGINWDDNSSDPTIADPASRQEWVMIWNTLAVDPATGKGDPDGRLLDLKTGRLRRIPFEGEISIPGCFSKDRAKVFVTGVSEERYGLYEIDLKTRKNRRLAADTLTSGFIADPILSPDGKTIAVGSTDFAKGPGNRQIYLVDVASGTGRMLGKPSDLSSMSWTSDGKGLIFGLQSGDDIGSHTVSRLDLNGSVSTITNGSSPLLLNDGRILFQVYSVDGRRWQWKTCDNEGKGVALFGDGLSKFAFPTPAPDGQRLMIIGVNDRKETMPFVFRIGELPDKPVVQQGGMWATPKWR